MKLDLSDREKTYTAIEVANILQSLHVEIVKAQTVLSAFKEPLEDALVKPDRTPSYCQGVVWDLDRSFELLSVLTDYLVILEQGLDTDTEVA